MVPRLGWNGTKVREVRTRLGVGAPLNASMTFDGTTEKAVKRLQRKIKVGANGIVDHRTWVRMTSRSWTMDNFRVNSQNVRSRRVVACFIVCSSLCGCVGSVLEGRVVVDGGVVLGRWRLDAAFVGLCCGDV